MMILTLLTVHLVVQLSVCCGVVILLADETLLLDVSDPTLGCFSFLARVCLRVQRLPVVFIEAFLNYAAANCQVELRTMGRMLKYGSLWEHVSSLEHAGEGACLR